jgi:hypothetical protein
MSVAVLALAVLDERRPSPDRASFRITSRAGQLAQKALGQTILVYRHSKDALIFAGAGRVHALEEEAAEYNRLGLAAFRSFAVPSFDEMERRDPGVRRSLSLDDSRYDHILQQALAADIGAQALAEAQAVFLQDRDAELDAYLKVHDRVLQRWKYRCVFTGAQFGPAETRPHPHLSVVAIRPRELGGPLHVRNYLPMLPEVERAWTHGHLTLGPSLGFQISAKRIDPELAERLLPLGKLDLPEEPSLWPDLELIAYHRTNIFDRD